MCLRNRLHEIYAQTKGHIEIVVYEHVVDYLFDNILYFRWLLYLALSPVNYCPYNYEIHLKPQHIVEVVEIIILVAQCFYISSQGWTLRHSARKIIELLIVAIKGIIRP